MNRWPSIADPRGGSPGADLDFLPGEDSGEQIASLWLGGGQQPCQRLDHRDAGAEPGEHLGQFRADPIRVSDLPLPRTAHAPRMPLAGHTGVALNGVIVRDRWSNRP